MKTESTKTTGRRGGLETLKKHGREHFSKIAKERWKNKKAKDILDFENGKEELDDLLRDNI